ncbi:hypothetical protein ACFFR3_16540 [Nonomuraea salmonea]|uniref:THIF-type NAD/FAD binding fold domain-containing protein n=1 Tax=Nonomuraea salmonea TaxID=46181 RepID=A0ABV5NLF0_9ACTN
MRPRVKPALRHLLRDESTLQLGTHPLRAVMLSGLTERVLKWIESLDGTRELETVLEEAALAGLDEPRARCLIDHLAAQGALHDASLEPGCLSDLPLAQRDRLRPELDALDLASTTLDGMMTTFERRRQARVRVYGAGRVGAQIVALLAAAGVGNIRVLDPALARPADLTPGGLTWAEVGLPREVGAVAIARRLTAGDPPPPSHIQSEDLAQRIPPPAGPAPTTRFPQDSAVRWGGITPSITGHPARAVVTHSPTPPAARPSPQRTTPPSPRTGGTSPAQAAKPAQGPRPAQATGREETPGPGSRSEPGTGPKRGSASGAEEGAAAGSRGKKPARRPKGVPRVSAYESELGEEACRPTVNVLAGGPYLGDKTDRPDLVILAPVTPLDGVLVNELIDLDIPHLLASAFEGHGTVGPLVLPGITACVHCLDLTRRDRDPEWGMVTAQLGGYPPGEIACDVALAGVVAAGAVGHALAFLDGKTPAVTNGTVEVTPDWRWIGRSWVIHPQCRCMRNNRYSLRMVMAPNRD